MRPERRFSKAGFTLTELLVVVTLIGIFAGVIVAEMRGTFADALLHSTARQVMSGLGLASSRAISLNRPFAFELSTADHKFTVRSKQNGRDSEEEDKSPESGKIDERITVQIRDPDGPAEQEPRANEPEKPRMERDIIYFYPDGTADAREIVLRDKESVELVLRISPITGRVRVIEDSR